MHLLKNSLLLVIPQSLSQQYSMMENKSHPLRLILKPYPNTFPRSEHYTARRLLSPKDDKESLLKVSPTPILPFLFLGNERDATDLSTLKQLNISYILNVTTHLQDLSQENLSGLRHKRLPALDNCRENIKQYFEEAFSFIGECL